MHTDVVIVGGGISGLYTALNIQDNVKVLVITKEELSCCNSYLAQGGISVARDSNDIQRFIEDTCRAGGYNNSLEAVNILVKESRQNINRLIQLGVKFDMDGNDFNYTKEGAHRINRILHCKDRTGEIIHGVLTSQCKSKKNITLSENVTMTDLIVKNNQCLGIQIKSGDVEDSVSAHITVLATGGVGGIFKSTTNNTAIKGEGMAIALKHGIEMKDLDKIQFHPTALYENSEKQRFLISESVRGEGAILINNKGERFIDELKPRDVVTKAIDKEIKNNNSKYVYLDARHLGKTFLINRFPTIYKECLNRGIDITKDLIPILPAQHYIMGGIKVDTKATSSANNLYAVGEVSCTGVHGNNRLASNSLLESLVFSHRAAIDIGIKLRKLNCDKYKIKKLSFNQSDNKDILINKILSLRGDLKDELYTNR
ncbi:L-aspartate oxidase [Clostridiaceae bacterium M8S5]|nr:L-aspartate oxidase [Clostridiaceae bacterium M8S5]